MIEAIGYKRLTLILISAILFAMALTFAGCKVEVTSTETQPYPYELTLCDKDGNYYHLRKWSGSRYDAHFLGTNITWKVD